MARYMLDTNVLIHFRQRRPSTLTRVAAMDPDESLMSIVSYGELRSGAEKSRERTALLTTLEAMTRIVKVADLTIPVGQEYGRVRSYLERRGELIGPNDLWIAAHALALGLTLITSNEREFRRVPGLAVENWAAA